MKKNMHHIVRFLFGISMSLSLTACSLLPKEEEQLQVQVMSQDVTQDYSLATAQVTDVALNETLSCTYAQLKDEKLSFSESGKKVGVVYVQMGDEVKKGEPLASLDTSETESKLEEYKDQLEKDRLLLKQEKESKVFYQTKIDSEQGSLADKDQYLWKVQDCQEQIRKYKDEIAVAEQKIENLVKELKKSVITAGMNGTVTYVMEQLLWKDTEAGKKVITITDTSDCAFQSEDKAAAKYLKKGQEVTIAVTDEKSYQAVVSKINKKKSLINFRIKDNDYSLSVGTRGTIALTLNSKEQVLAIPKEALHSTEDFYYVYYLNESGVREMKTVSVGLIGDTLVEITDGLKENDSVIIY